MGGQTKGGEMEGSEAGVKVFTTTGGHPGWNKNKIK
jgi:hypothetical protein